MHFGSCFVHSSTSLTCVAIDAKIIIFFFQEFTIEKGGFFFFNFKNLFKGFLALFYFIDFLMNYSQYSITLLS